MNRNGRYHREPYWARVIAVSMSTLFLWAPAGAIRFDWTDAEVQCAWTVGVDLRGDPSPGSREYVKRLAWLSDLIVYGRVGKIRPPRPSGVAP
jgi:hypothetical protein